MARSFNGSSDYLRYAGAVVTATPLTMSCWIKRPTTLVNGVVMGVYNSASSGNVNHFRMSRVFSDDSDAQILATACGPTSGASSATCTRTITDWPEGTWGHCAAVYESDSSKYAYAQGVASAQETTSKTPSGLNRTTIGCRDNTTQASFFSESAAESAIWNVALTASEIAALAAGVCPLLVRPTALVAYWPLWGIYSPEIDLVNEYDMTVTGAAAADHSPAIYQVGRSKIFLPQSAPPAAVQQQLMLLGMGC